MSVSWLELGKFWHMKRILWKVKRATLQSKIIESAISGLLSLVLSDVQFGKLESKLCGYMRSMLMGSAHRVGVNGKRVAMGRLELFKHRMILPLHFTDAIRRVKWLRQMIIHPVAHRQLVAALLRDFCIDGVV